MLQEEGALQTWDLRVLNLVTPGEGAGLEKDYGSSVMSAHVMGLPHYSKCPFKSLV